jgi:rod shape determining protein RodA
MVISTMVIYSGTVNDPVFKHENFHIKNLKYYCLGLAVLFASAFFDYRVLLKISPYIYGIGILLLIAVYLFTSGVNGAKGWFTLPLLGVNFQPAEFMKVAIILFVAFYLRKKDGETLELASDVIPAGLITFIPFALVIIQPDLGNAIIYIVILLGMLWIGNIKYSHVLVGLGSAIAGLFLFIFLFQTYHDQIKAYLEERRSGHWVTRIDTFLNPEAASADASYHVTNSIRAIGSGRLLGDNYLQGNSIQSNFVPYTYSDSIFVVIGEEFGFVGSAILLLMYFLLIYRMIIISIHSTEPGGSFIIIGIVSMFVFQIFENIGMLIGIMPLTGITLPFISYGGTSLLINMMSVGIALSIKLHQDEPSPYGTGLPYKS